MNTNDKEDKSRLIDELYACKNTIHLMRMAAETLHSDLSYEAPGFPIEKRIDEVRVELDTLKYVVEDVENRLQSCVSYIEEKLEEKTIS